MRRHILLAGLSALALAAPARADDHHKVEVHPYLEVDAGAFSDLKDGGGSSTYAGAAAGIDASIQTRRTQAEIDYRYEHRFALDHDSSDADLHSGLARLSTEIAQGFAIEGGAIATRTRSDIRGSAANPYAGNPDNISNLYSAYVGPTFTHSSGDLSATALYRFGYTKVEEKTRGLLATGQQPLGLFDDSTSHVALASIGMKSGALPFGWTLSGGFEREDAGELDSRFQQEDARLDVVVPIEATIAIVGGVGYEKIKSSQRDALRDASGAPVVDNNGRFVTDKSSPRLLAYDQDGFIWDAGVSWRPSRRTSLEARVGRRYGSWTYIGSFSYQPSADMAFQAGVYDEVQTYGRQVNDSLSSLPTEFTLARDPFGGFGGCAFGGSGGGAGSCLDPVLQSIASGTYRTRGVNALWRYGRGATSAGLGFGYAQRKFFAPVGVLAFTNGVKDESWYGQAYVSRRLDRASTLEASVYADLFDSGIGGAPDVLGLGATTMYSRTFGQRFSGIASLGIYSSKIDGVDSTLTGAAQVGARYVF